MAARSALQLSGLTVDTGRVYGGHRARATVTFSRKTPAQPEGSRVSLSGSGTDGSATFTHPN